MPGAKELYDRLFDDLAARPGVTRGQMFGMPCIKVGGKAFAGFDNGATIFKLAGDAHTRALALDGARLFDPRGMGRPMKEWVRVPESQAEEWTELAVSACEYVASLANK